MLETISHKASCADCPEVWPNEKTTVKSRDNLRAWRERHQKKTGHTVRTAATHVRVYEGKKT